MIGLLNQNITVYSHTSTRSRYGKATQSNARTVKARVELTNKTVMGANRELIPIDAVIFLAPDVTIDTQDRLTHNSIDYRVIKKMTQVDGSGSTHHVELLVQKWQA